MSRPVGARRAERPEARRGSGIEDAIVAASVERRAARIRAREEGEALIAAERRLARARQHGARIRIDIGAAVRGQAVQGPACSAPKPRPSPSETAVIAKPSSRPAIITTKAFT